MLRRDPVAVTEHNNATWEKFRSDVFIGYAGTVNRADQIALKLEQCSLRIEGICRPVLDRQFGRKPKTAVGKTLSWSGCSPSSANTGL